MTSRKKLYLAALAVWICYMIVVFVYHNWLTVPALIAALATLWLYGRHLLHDQEK